MTMLEKAKAAKPKTKSHKNLTSQLQEALDVILAWMRNEITIEQASVGLGAGHRNNVYQRASTILHRAATLGVIEIKRKAAR